MRACLSIAVFAASICLQPVFAAPVIFSGQDLQNNTTDPRPNADAARTAFLAAVGATSSIDFENQVVGNGNPVNPAFGVTVTFSNFGGNTISNDASTILGYNTTPAGSLFLRLDSAQGFTTELTFAFTSPVEFFGMFITGAGDGLGGVRLLFNDGATQNLLIANADEHVPGRIAFFGFTDFGAPFSSVTIRIQQDGGISDDVIGIDDVLLPAIVPEPASLWLAGTGLGLLMWDRCRRLRGNHEE